MKIAAGNGQAHANDAVPSIVERLPVSDPGTFSRTEGQPSALRLIGSDLASRALMKRLRPWKSDARHAVKDLARAIDRHQDTILNWVNRRARPDVDAIWDCAKFFHDQRFIQEIFGAAFDGDMIVMSRKTNTAYRRDLDDALS